MYCQECQQRPATLHFTKIINGEKNEIHICEQCAKEKGDFIPGSNSFSIHNLLSGLLNFEQHPLSESTSKARSQQVMQCSKCGMTYSEFAKIGRFGCSNCYKTFASKLDPVLKRIHGGNTDHSGKIPKRIGNDLLERKKINQLRQHLQQLIHQEEFEEAAQVRDQIKSMEKRLGGSD
ncbi:UvrB/UvrC motif-containing protein [Pseudalkalibacillus berkeleyi]|uniref:UvrB/UvrC motif-containing protein n=1 Tax=Pseudalkalibacillus berkeleyi TaxID=1069813 RepID=A0ABS9H6T4_9BACL|nr:UvrB/UvrC motif-containing protein [Pseudalkalibacillus berkeleyi]MCF6139505.1 UvrB/UvrC motif-containing protein [Pseudalkalibacillus berkeleyi]